MKLFKTLLALALTCILGSILLGFSIFTKAKNNLPVKHIIVIGTGAAGIGFINEVLDQNSAASITWISADRDNPYDRTKLDSVVSKKISEEKPILYNKNVANIKVLLGKKVISINSKKKIITLDDKSTYHYDYIFLATGSKPTKITTKSINKSINGLFNFYTLQDAKNINAYIEQNNINNAVVIGCGINGLEAADALFRRKIKVTLIDKNEHILQNTLNDAVASQAIEKNIKKTPSIRWYSRASLKNIIEKNGILEGIELTNGTILKTSLVISAVGVKPNTKLAQQLNISMKNGALIVDETMKTSDPSIYAGGDIVLIHDKGTNALTKSCKWGDAIQQGRIAASNIFGREKKYQGSLIGFRTSFFGNTLVASGLLKNYQPHYKIVEHSGIDNNGRIFYHKIILDKNIIKGFIVCNNANHARRLRTALAEQKTFNYKKFLKKDFRLKN